MSEFNSQTDMQMPEQELHPGVRTRKYNMKNSNNNNTNNNNSNNNNDVNQLSNESVSDNNKSDNTKSSNKQRQNKRLKKIACTECRQQKAKCDASEKQPGPCSRCEKRNIPCKLDQEFKRTFKRAKIDELVKEYEIIKSKLKISSGSISMTDNSPINSPISNSNSNSSYNNIKFVQNDIPNSNNNNNSHNNLLPQSSAYFINNTQNQFLPSLKSIQPNNNNQFNTGMSLPDPNIFHPTTNNGNSSNITTPTPIPIPIPNTTFINTVTTSKSNQPQSINVSRSTSFYSNNTTKANSPLTRSYSPIQMINNHTNSPLAQLPSYTNNLNNNSNNNNNIGTNIDNSDQSKNLNRVSSYNFSTLISAANVTERNNNMNNNHNSSNHDSNLYSRWKAQNRPVRKPHIKSSLLECTSKTLGDITLTDKQIVVLYSTFLTYYHPLLPVIDMEKEIEKIYRLCPALFWTIMFTALRGHHTLLPVITPEECRSLYFKLSPILKGILAEITISPITRYVPNEVDEPILNASSVYSVQAFLIYTFWPPLTSSLSADSSWNTIGIAFYQAIRIGLHTPGLTSDRMKLTNKDLMNEQIRTWIACNIVSQTIASVFGFPGFFQPFGSLSLSSSLNGDEIPHCLRQMLEIEKFEAQVEKTLNNNSFDQLQLNPASDRLPLIQLLESELNQLELKLCAYEECSMDDFRILSLYATRLHLLSYYFMDNREIASFELKKGIIKAYNAALAIIQHCKNSQDRAPDFVNNLPSSYILVIWQASVIIARLINSSYKNILDISTGIQLYQIAIELVMKSSVIKHDLSYRSCGIMKSTWNLFKTLDEDNPESLFQINVRSRMSANIFFDTLWVLREKCGMIKLKPTREKNSVSEGSTGSDSEVEDVGERNDNNDNTDSISHPNTIKSESTIPDISKRISHSGTPESMGKEYRSQSKDSSLSSRRKSNYHPESAARRIISTIPLDPQPIALAETSNDSAHSSKHSSPYISNYKSPSNTTNTSEATIKKMFTPQSNHNNPQSHHVRSPQASSKHYNNYNNINNENNNSKSNNNNNNNNNNNLESSMVTAPGLINNNMNLNMDLNNNDVFTANNWNLGTEIDSDMLFKDIESVMDEFGFHAE